jgi:hypothetical protein
LRLVIETSRFHCNAVGESLPQHPSDDEDENRSAKSASEQEVDQRVTDCGKHWYSYGSHAFEKALRMPLGFLRKFSASCQNLQESNASSVRSARKLKRNFNAAAANN